MIGQIMGTVQPCPLLQRKALPLRVSLNKPVRILKVRAEKANAADKAEKVVETPVETASEEGAPKLGFADSTDKPQEEQLAYLDDGTKKNNKRSKKNQMQYKVSLDKNPPKKPITSAKDGLAEGMLVFDKGEGDAKEAYRIFNAALSMNPDKGTSALITYNIGCIYAKFELWKEAADCIVTAINSETIRLSDALKDDDIRFLRERREWLDALSKVRGGVTQKVRVRDTAEYNTTFRLPRQYLYIALAVGGGIATIVTSSRLIKAITQPGTYALDGELRNFIINLVVIAITVAVFLFENKEQDKVRQKVWKQEDIGQLQLKLQDTRIIPLISLRQEVRVMIIAGSEVFVQEQVSRADAVYRELRECGICLLPVVLSKDDLSAALRRMKAEENGTEAKKAGFVERVEEEDIEFKSKYQIRSMYKDKTWLLDPYNVKEWSAYVTAQTKRLAYSKKNVYALVSLDGGVRRSGVGSVPWDAVLNEVPPLKSIRTKLLDGNA